MASHRNLEEIQNDAAGRRAEATQLLEEVASLVAKIGPTLILIRELVDPEDTTLHD